MRTLTRSAVVGILILSCGDDIIGPGPQSSTCGTFLTQPDTVFALFPESLHLVVGSADQVWADWRLDCDPIAGPPFLSNADIDWVVRDPTVAAITETTQFGYPDEPTRGVRPLAPGRTFLVAEAGGFVDSVAVFVPDTVVMGSVRHLAAGGDVSCAVSDGDIALCWGFGGGSVLGQWEVDPAVGTCWGTPCSPMPVPRKTDARSVQVSSTHACSLDTFGSAWCWGDNYALQLGVSDPRPLYDPVPVSGGRAFASLTLGLAHTCGLTSVGAAYCWGDHTAGRLGGNQRTGPIATPALVAGGLQWVSLDARTETTCGVTDAGHLYCWGVFGNLTGLAGTETCVSGQGKEGPTEVPCSYVPLRMPLDTGLTGDTLFVQVSGLCARTSPGSVFCFDPARKAYAPVVGFGPLAAISGQDNHTCGLTSGGTAWCWGWNGEGQLGDGTTTFRGGPVAVTGGHAFTQIAAGSRHTCGLTADGEVWCWGANHVGQAGTSILSEPWAPVKVHGQG